MDFFIVGYPKCGTTSLYSYLKDHPDVFLPKLKEPHFFSEDYPGSREVTTEPEYLALFRDAATFQLRGDASASVIHSDVALDRMLARHPKAKFIVMLREPIAALRSYHGELLHNLNEDVEDFEQAWRLQIPRAAGREIPDTCKEPRLLQYAEIFCYADQLKAFFARVPAEQRLVLMFEEFFADPHLGYAQVLNFLGLEDDGRMEFDAVNVARRHRFRWLAAKHRQLVNDNGRLYRGLKAVMSRAGIHPSHILARVNRKPGGKQLVSEGFEAELLEHFQPHIETAKRLFGNKIENWWR